MPEETMQFQAEVSKLLKIVANSLYSQKEIFLRELISNASDACDRLRYEALTNSELLGGDSNFRVTLSVDPKAKTLTVSDNGIGIPPGQQAQIFNMFEQSDNGQGVVGEGLGIGLALVKQLVELHGGEIVLQKSLPGEGSTFEVRLPLAN